MCQGIQEMIERGRNEGSKMKAYKTAEESVYQGFSAEETSLLVGKIRRTIAAWYKGNLPACCNLLKEDARGVGRNIPDDG